jgi:hypothetical protein
MSKMWYNKCDFLSPAGESSYHFGSHHQPPFADKQPAVYTLKNGSICQKSRWINFKEELRLF